MSYSPSLTMLRCPELYDSPHHLKSSLKEQLRYHSRTVSFCVPNGRKVKVGGRRNSLLFHVGMLIGMLLQALVSQVRQELFIIGKRHSMTVEEGIADYVPSVMAIARARVVGVELPDPFERISVSPCLPLLRVRLLHQLITSALCASRSFPPLSKYRDRAKRMLTRSRR